MGERFRGHVALDGLGEISNTSAKRVVTAGFGYCNAGYPGECGCSCPRASVSIELSN